MDIKPPTTSTDTQNAVWPPAPAILEVQSEPQLPKPWHKALPAMGGLLLAIFAYWYMHQIMLSYDGVCQVVYFLFPWSLPLALVAALWSARDFMSGIRHRQWWSAVFGLVGLVLAFIALNAGFDNATCLN